MSKLYGQHVHRYTPPDVGLFKKFRRSLAWFAKDSVTALSIDFENAHVWLNRFEKGSDISGKHSENLVSLYSGLAEAYEATWRLLAMSEEDRSAHFAIDGEVDPQALRDRYLEVSGMMRGWEKRQPDVIQATLNVQMEESLADWERALAWAEEKPGERPYVVDENELMESIEDFSGERGSLEYFRIAMHMVRHVLASEEFAANATGMPVQQRLRDVKFEAFEKRLLALDSRFRRILGDRRAEKPRFWTDPEFWWDHPPKRKGGWRS